jgi:hypothetical protein
MPNVNYTIATNLGNPFVEGTGWTGTIVVPSLSNTPGSPGNIPTSVTGVLGSLTVTFTPDATNGYYVYPSTTDSNHYVTFRSQNIATQYPNAGYSLDIWSATLYSDINGGKTWQGLITDSTTSPYYLNNTKYTLLYDYTPGSPTAAMWCKGGAITFSAG